MPKRSRFSTHSHPCPGDCNSMVTCNLPNCILVRLGCNACRIKSDSEFLKENLPPINPMMQMEEMLNQIGSSLYSEEFACELLAWFHVFGGNNEAVVLNKGLNSALMTCSKKLNIEGGETPKPELMILWRKKAEELQGCVQNGYFFPEWMIKICNRYNLRIPEEKIDFLVDDFRIKINQKKKIRTKKRRK